jgi:hypothetical protein
VLTGGRRVDRGPFAVRTCVRRVELTSHPRFLPPRTTSKVAALSRRGAAPTACAEQAHAKAGAVALCNPSRRPAATPSSLPVGLTIEQIKGRIGATDYSDVFEGCVVTGGTMSVRESSIATLSLDIIAQTSAARAAAGTPTFTSADPIMQWHAGNLAWSSLNGALKSIEITVRQNLERRQLTGSLYTARPYPRGAYSVTARVVREWDENTMYTAAKALTQADATLTFTGPSSQTLAMRARRLDLAARPMAKGSARSSKASRLISASRRPMSIAADALVVVPMFKSSSMAPPIPSLQRCAT